MTERFIVSTMDQLSRLDPEEIMEGYRDGFNGEPEPGNNRSDSYYHGWRNGRVDGGYAPSDWAQMALARECVKGMQNV